MKNDAVPSNLQVDFAGEWFTVDPAKPFLIGREGDLVLDDNPYLHRHFLEISYQGRLWWLHNVGSRLSASISSGEGSVQSWLAPEASIPLVFGDYVVVFTAGATTYELIIAIEQPEFRIEPVERTAVGTATIMPLRVGEADKRLLVALAEPMLRQELAGPSQLPSNAAVAERLGWTQTKFNRRLDKLCDKLDRLGVHGLRAEPGKLATNRRARLVEYAISSRMITRHDLPLLDLPETDTQDD